MDNSRLGPRPLVIQGGMGVAVSSWSLAKVVAAAGQLGVVSGTGLDTVVCRRLQLGDPGGHIRRALAHFPVAEMARRVESRYFISGGKAPEEPFRLAGRASERLTPELTELLVVSNFVEVFLAKEGHAGQVGINYLEKIQTVTLASLLGAMLAGADYVLMGAGIPRSIPGALDRLAEGQAAESPLHVEGATGDDDFVTRLDPCALLGADCFPLPRPRFLAIVASATLANMLVRKASGHVDGFVVEGPTAGGHNAPPRGTPKFNRRGEPIYSHRDQVDLEPFRRLGRPFWLAGSHGSPAHLAEALGAGAAGIQVGTAFAFCDESGLQPKTKRLAIRMAKAGTADVLTDPHASPAGFPFKVLDTPGSLSETDVYEARPRVCDLGYLRRAYRKADGSIGWRCPAESPTVYQKKGGDPSETEGRKCLCNALLSTVGLAQVRNNGRCEPPLITSGDDIEQIVRFLPSADADSYSARDVLAVLLEDRPAGEPTPSDSIGNLTDGDESSRPNIADALR